ncbi:hypothetical protein A2U01_0085684, partial [Trifolium medium]|nr:hypothetical protein [Trifolium medium]
QLLKRFLPYMRYEDCYLNDSPYAD